MAQNFLPNFGQRTTGQSLRAVLSLVSFELSTIFTGAGGRKPTCTNWVRVSLFKIKLNFVPRQISVSFGQFSAVSIVSIVSGTRGTRWMASVDECEAHHDIQQQQPPPPPATSFCCCCSAAGGGWLVLELTMVVGGTWYLFCCWMC